MIATLGRGPGAAEAQPRHGIAMHGEPALPPGFEHLPYADPSAPQGGLLRQGTTGSFDSGNPFIVQGEKAAGVVLLRPAAPGTGVIAGGPVRAVLECAGVHDVLSKSLGSSNQINIVHATVEALRMLEEPEAVAARRGMRVEDVTPAALLKARAEGQTETAGVQS